MNAIEHKAGKENRASRDEKFGFLATVYSLPRACSIDPVWRLSIVSFRAMLPAKASRPIKDKAQKAPLQDMSFSRRAPKIGATAGDIKTMD